LKTRALNTRVLNAQACLVILLAASTSLAQPQTTPMDLAAAPLNRAYDAVKAKSYDAAIVAFQEAIRVAPAKTSIRKDLAYIYLKIGDSEAARDQFAEAVKLDPNDESAALEYAYLCNETGQRVNAHRIFDRLRKTGNASAEQAFQNIDRPLAEGIASWSKAIELSPDNFSAQEELARLAEQRDDAALAANHYEKAWRLRPQAGALLLDLAREWKILGRVEDSKAALLSASRRSEPRTAERARALLPGRYPYVYEFQKAVALDPTNLELRRELAYLHLEMGKKPEAEDEFRRIVGIAPNDTLSAAQLGFLLLARNDIASAMPLLQSVLKSKDEVLADRVRTALRVPQNLRKREQPEPALLPVLNPDDPKSMGERSLRAGYLKDALKYLKIAHENNPLDYAVMLKLGWTNNMLHDDKQAMEWFNLARKSSDQQISREASQAFGNLRPEQEPFRTTVWTFPFYSSRWKDVFSYSQIKTEFKLGSLPIHPYLTTRIIGDTRNTTDATPTLGPQFLSESSVIIGVGIATANYKGLSAWGEAGEAIRYRKRPDIGFMTPDYRGGLSFGRGVGNNLGPESHGLFFETSDDAVFVSRFANDFILYSQNHTGYTLPSLGGLQLQFYWNTNLTADAKRQYWANFFEQGPGIKFRLPGMPRALSFTANAVRGQYLVNQGNPRGPIFYDFRVGLWYAFTH
jgi:tetratricopeptide (TPR) repeat protein